MLSSTRSWPGTWTTCSQVGLPTFPMTIIYIGFKQLNVKSNLYSTGQYGIGRPVYFPLQPSYWHRPTPSVTERPDQGSSPKNSYYIQKRPPVLAQCTSAHSDPLEPVLSTFPQIHKILICIFSLLDSKKPEPENQVLDVESSATPETYACNGSASKKTCKHRSKREQLERERELLKLREESPNQEEQAQDPAGGEGEDLNTQQSSICR